MANTPTEGLNPADPLDGSELVHIVKGGNSRRATAQAIADLSITWAPHSYGEASATGASAYNGGVWFGNLVTADEDGRIDSVVCGLAAAEPGINFIPVIYANNAGAAGAVLATGPQVNNGTLGDNVLPLSAPLVVTAGQQLWIGAYQATTGGISAVKTAGSPSRYFIDDAPVNNPGGALTVWPDGLRIFAKGSTQATEGVEEAPIDGSAYVRKDGEWIEDAGGDVEEAPSNGTAYVRKDGTWVPETGGGSGSGDVEEAPTDGKAYVRKDGAWVEDTFGGGGGSTVIIGGGDGSAWRTEAVGTGASQDITIPVTGLDPAEVMVFVNGILFDTDEYSIAGTTLTITTNAADDEIAIYPVGASSGGGGGGGGTVVDGMVAPTATGPSGTVVSEGAHVAKYWRVRATTQAMPYLSLTNVEFRSVADAAETHAGTGTPIASSSYIDTPATGAFDGDNATTWASNGDSASWVGFNFNTPRSVAQLAIRDRSSALNQTMSAFVIERSNDGSAWTVEWSVSGITWSASDAEQKTFLNTTEPTAQVEYYPTKVAALNDVDLDGISDGDVLVWDATEGKFLPGAGGSGGGSGSGGTGFSAEIGPYAPPTAAWFGVAKNDALTVTLTDDTKRGLSFKSTGGNAQDQISLATRDVSGWGTAWKVRARIIPSMTTGQYPAAGLAIYNSANGKNGAIAAEHSATPIIGVYTRPSLSGFTSVDSNATQVALPTWFEIERAGATIYFRYSNDGITWQETTYDAVTNLGAMPTHVGLYWTGFSSDNWVQKAGGLCTFYEDPDYPSAARAQYLGGGSGGGGGSGTGRILASARINCAVPATPTISGGINVASVTKTGTGLYRITFTTPIDISKAGFNGGGQWADFASRAQMAVGIERASGSGLTTTYVDITTGNLPATGNIDADNWFSFEVYDASVQARDGGGGGTGSSTPWYWSPPTLASLPNEFGGSEVTATEDADVGLTLRTTTNSVTHPCGRSIPLPSAGAVDWWAQCRVDYTQPFNMYFNTGLIIHNAAETKFLQWSFDTRGQVHLVRMNNTAYDGWEQLLNCMPPKWFRMDYTAATGIIVASISANGKNWVPIYTHETKAADFGSVHPTHVGVCLSNQDHGFIGAATFDHFTTSFD